MIIENGGHFWTLNHAYHIWKKCMFIVENIARKLTDSFLEEQFVAYSPSKRMLQSAYWQVAGEQSSVFLKRIRRRLHAG